MASAHDTLVGALALRAGLVDEDRLKAVLSGNGNGNGSHGRPLDQLLLERGWIDEAQRAALEAEAVRLMSRPQDDDPDRTVADIDLAPLRPAAPDWDNPSTQAQDSTATPPTTQRAPAEVVDPPTRLADAMIDSSTMPTIDQTAIDPSSQPTLQVDAQAETRMAPGAGDDGRAPSSGFSDGSTLGHVLISSLGEPPEGDTTRYTFSHVHAKGGIGQVWLARDSSMGREVALKEIRGDRSATNLIWTRFVEEARITGQLEHPGIVPVYEVGRRKGDRNPYYTMRFVRGRTLGEAIRACRSLRKAGNPDPLAERRLFEAFVSICQTVAYAHARGVIHRDLKSANVVLGDYGEVIVLDWGLAKLVNDPNSSSNQGGVAEAIARANATGDDTPIEHDATRLDQVEGTPVYMAPEQAAGWTHKIDARTDVYGLGAILYEILTGRPPFERADLKEMLRRVRQDPPVGPRTVDPLAPAALEAVSLKALSKSPDSRYQTAEALADEVCRWLADEPVHAYPDPWTKRLTRWAKKHRTAVAAAAALVGTSIVGLSIGYVVVRAERDEAARSRDFARGAVNTMYTDVAENWLEDHLDTTQKRFLEEALAYFTDFAARDANQPGMALDTARAYHRIGEIQRKLGRNAKAEAAYQEAIRRLQPLLQSGDDAEAVRHLARAESRLGALRIAQGSLEEGDLLLAAAIERLKPLTGDDAALDLGRALDLRGDGLRAARKNDAALASYESAVERLRPLLVNHPDDPAIRSELGRSLTDLGLIRGERSTDTAPTRKDYEEAMAVQKPLLQQFPTIPRIRQNLGLTATRLAILQARDGDLADAEANYRIALENFRRLATDFPLRPEYRRELSRSFQNLATLLQASLGRPSDALAVYAEAIPVLRTLAHEVPDEPKPLRDLAIISMNIAGAHEQIGQLDEAQRHFDEAATLFDRLDTRFPDIPDNQAAHAELLVALAGFHNTRGEFAQAEPLVLRARAILESLVKTHADTPEYQTKLAECLITNGATLAYLPGRQAEAFAVYTEAEALCDQFLKTDPKNPAWREPLARVLTNLSDLETLPATDAELPEREKTARRAITLFTELQTERPGDVNASIGVASIALNLGEIVEKRDPSSNEPAALYAQSADVFRQAIATLGDSPPPDLRRALAYARTDQAKYAIRRAQLDDARRWLDQALEDQKAAVVAKRVPQFVNELTGQLTLAGDLAIDQGRHADAVRLAMDLTRLVPENPSARVAAATLMARAIPLVESDPQTAPSQRDSLARTYADRAVAQLRVAVDSGLNNPTALQTNNAFQPLQTRDDFQTLLRDLTAPTLE